MNQGPDTELDDALLRTQKILDRLQGHQAMGDTNHSTAVISVNAGGVGVWIAVTCCLIMTAMTAFAGFWLNHQAKQIDDLNAYLQAIYQQAPALQESIKKQEKQP